MNDLQYYVDIHLLAWQAYVAQQDTYQRSYFGHNNHSLCFSYLWNRADDLFQLLLHKATFKGFIITNHSFQEGKNTALLYNSAYWRFLVFNWRVQNICGGNDVMQKGALFNLECISIVLKDCIWIITDNSYAFLSEENSLFKAQSM